MLGINEGTSRSNLAKARLKLQEWIKVNLSESSPMKPDKNVQRTV